MSKPTYEQHCAYGCTDRNGKPRDGVQWIHVDGKTSWVCGPCTNAIFGAWEQEERRLQRQAMRRAQSRLEVIQ